MPASSNSSAAYGWRESWPPAQIRLQQAASTGDHSSDGTAMVKEETRDDLHDDEMQLTDDNPLVYFLTPRPLLSVDDDGESYFVDDSDSSSFFYDNEHDNDDDISFYSGGGMDFEFDAGIEDATHPLPIIRSVSPSSLANSLGGGGRTSRAAMRPPTPPRARESLHPGSNGLTGADPLMFGNMDGTLDDADGEHYIHFGDGDYSSQQALSSSPAKGRLSPRSSSHSLSPLSPLSSLSSSPASPRPLPDIHDLYTHHHLNNSQSHLTAAGAMIVRRRSPRSWRVPSPDVFSIEEETEEELSTGVAVAAAAADTDRPARHHRYKHHHERHLQVEAAKPPKKKRVRFVLPGEEIA